MRHRRLSQLEDYVGRMEHVVAESTPSKVEVPVAQVLDAELSGVLGQLEEEVHWGSKVQAQMQQVLTLTHGDRSLRTLLDDAFIRHDLDADGTVRLPSTVNRLTPPPSWTGQSLGTLSRSPSPQRWGPTQTLCSASLTRMRMASSRARSLLTFIWPLKGGPRTPDLSLSDSLCAHSRNLRS